jgi:membrane protein YqaA with SNARE-associated domain
LINEEVVWRGTLNLNGSLSHAASEGLFFKRPTLDSLLQYLLEALALPSVGLGAIFVISALAATILPFGSEPIFVAYLALKPELFWLTVAVATAGNSLGGFITYWMGVGAHQIYVGFKRPKPDAAKMDPDASRPVPRAEVWVRRFGPPMLLCAWLPVVGDPLCAVAGWLRLPWLPCLVYMTLGKLARYLVLGGAWQLLVSFF